MKYRFVWKVLFMDSIWAKSVKMPEFPFPVAGTIGFANQAQFHPLKFLSQNVHKLNIYEHTFVKELQENAADVKGMHVDECVGCPFVIIRIICLSEVEITGRERRAEIGRS